MSASQELSGEGTHVSMSTDNLNLSYSFALAFLFSVGILIICYPGFMSYDSIRMLEEARGSVGGGIYPTMPVYILRLLDIGGYGPTVMLFIQNFLSLLSLTVVLKMLRVRWYVAILALTLIVAMPSVLGAMLVLWKDVTTAATLCIAIVMIFWASRNPGSRIYQWMKWGTLCILILSTLIRFNAATSSVVIAVYWAATFYGQSSWRTKFAILFLFLMIVGVANKVVNQYALPDFRKLAPNSLAYLVMAYDLVGISKWANHSYVPICVEGSICPPKAPVSDIDKVYSSLGAMAIKNSNDLLPRPVQFVPRGVSNAQIASAWLFAIKESPLSYLKYREDLFSEIIGAKPYKTFEPTHFNRIDENSFGIKFTERAITVQVLRYIDWSSGETLGKPWVFFILAAVAAIGVAFKKVIPRDLKMLSMFAVVASFAYICPFFILSGSGEVRYVYPSLMLGSLPILILLFGSSTTNNSSTLGHSGVT